MLSYRTILVPVDFEEASDSALQAAADLAQKFNAKLILMHAYELPFYPYPGTSLTATNDLPRAIHEAATAGLDGMVGRVKAQVPDTESLLRAGAPADEILAVAKERNVDLIVMGTHGRKGFAHALLGSIAEKVLRRADLPVLTVHAAPTVTPPAA